MGIEEIKEFLERVSKACPYIRHRHSVIPAFAGMTEGVVLDMGTRPSRNKQCRRAIKQVFSKVRLALCRNSLVNICVKGFRDSEVFLFAYLCNQVFDPIDRQPCEFV